MKKIGLMALFLAGSLVALAGEKPVANSVPLNTNNSEVKWTAKKVTGSHNGTISIKSGDVIVENGGLVGGSLIMDMNSIKVTDIEDAGTNKKLLGHLKSADFFDVSNHSEATFKIVTVRKMNAKPGEPDYQIIGKLTIKGITKDAVFPAFITVDGNNVKVKGQMYFNRTSFDIKYGSGRFFDNLGDRMIYDDVFIEFDVTTAS